MPVLRHAKAVCCLCLSVFLATPSLADAPPASAALRLLLATIPDVADAPAGGYQIDFGDVRAARSFLEANGVAPLDPEERALAALMRGGTQIFGRSASAQDARFRLANGFGFDDVETNLQYARPPIWLNLLSLGFGAGAVAADLLPGAGFTHEERHGHSVFWRGEQDNAVMQPNLPPDDLYGGAVRRSARLAVAGDILAFSNAWAVLDTVLTTEMPRMVDDAEIAALLDALDAAAHPGERLILANLFVEALPAEYPGTLLMADLFGDDGHVTIVALRPTQILPAADQAARLGVNWSGLAINDAGDSFADLIGADAETAVIEAGAPVLVMRLDTRIDAEASRLLFNQAYRTLQSALMRRDFERLLSDRP
ncbi:hypothetical protein [Nioella sp.]|uniref:hypothetical protein n=1 Tax=Nioella sp. TaxID=1912091 RepID=UPI003B51A31C